MKHPGVPLSQRLLFYSLSKLQDAYSMKAIYLTGLADFIARVVADISVGSETSDKSPQILVFCNASFLEGFQYSAGNLTVAQIDALNKIFFVTNTSMEAIKHHLRQIWFGPRDRQNPRSVLAFYDLIVEGPISAYENASEISLILYMMYRASLQALAPRFYLNIAPQTTADPELYTTLQMLNLASKWTTIPVHDATI